METPAEPAPDGAAATAGATEGETEEERVARETRVNHFMSKQSRDLDPEFYMVKVIDMTGKDAKLPRWESVEKTKNTGSNTRMAVLGKGKRKVGQRLTLQKLGSSALSVGCYVIAFYCTGLEYALVWSYEICLGRVCAVVGAFRRVTWVDDEVQGCFRPVVLSCLLECQRTTQ